MKCYELPDGENPPENEDDLQLLLASEPDSDTEACSTDDELSENDKSSSDEESEEEKSGSGIELYLSKPGTSYWGSNNVNSNDIGYNWNSFPRIDLPPTHWSPPPANLGMDYSLHDYSNQYTPTHVHWDQDSPLRDRSSQDAPPGNSWNQNLYPLERLRRLASLRDPLDQHSLPRDLSNAYAPSCGYLDQDYFPPEQFSRPVPFRVPLDQDSPPRDHWSHLVQDTPPHDHYSYNAPPRVHLSQDSPPRNHLNEPAFTFPRPLFHDMIYNRDEFLASQNNENNRRNFVAASNIYQSYLDIAEEADNERLAANASNFLNSLD